MRLVGFGSAVGPVLQMFRLFSAYSLSRNTVKLAETSRLSHRPNQPVAEAEGAGLLCGERGGEAKYPERCREPGLWASEHW
jgi:hypothetical protein